MTSGIKINSNISFRHIQTNITKMLWFFRDFFRYLTYHIESYLIMYHNCCKPECSTLFAAVTCTLKLPFHFHFTVLKLLSEISLFPAISLILLVFQVEKQSDSRKQWLIFLKNFMLKSCLTLLLASQLWSSSLAFTRTLLP